MLRRGENNEAELPRPSQPARLNTGWTTAIVVVAPPLPRATRQTSATTLAPGCRVGTDRDIVSGTTTSNGGPPSPVTRLVVTGAEPVPGWSTLGTLLVPRTVAVMFGVASTRAQALNDLRTAQLGDVLTTPDGQTSTVRAVEPQLACEVGALSGFVLAGEIGPTAVLLGLPATDAEPVALYVPLDQVPPHARGATEVLSGVISYWSPHLPGMSGAMGELGYKVCVVPGSSDPMVLMWRGRELVVFVKSSVCSPDAVRVQPMAVDARRSEVDVERVAAVVRSPSDTGGFAGSFEVSEELYTTFTRR